MNIDNFEQEFQKNLGRNLCYLCLFCFLFWALTGNSEMMRSVGDFFYWIANGTEFR